MGDFLPIWQGLHGNSPEPVLAVRNPVSAFASDLADCQYLVAPLLVPWATGSRVAGYFRFAAFLLVNGHTVDFAQVVKRSNANRPLVTRHITEGDPQAAGNSVPTS